MDKFPTFVVIPTRYAIDHLLKLLNSIKNDKIDEILILDNGHTDEDHSRIYHWAQENFPLANIYRVPGLSVYEMWNWGWKYAKAYAEVYEGFNLAILNDDIEIWPDSITEMANALRRDEELGIVSLDPLRTEVMPHVQYVTTTAGGGGLAGFAFMMKGELPIPYIDENLKLYWGDDDLIKQISRAGYKIGVLRGVPVEHAGSLTIRQMDQGQRYQIMEEDRTYFNKKYSEHREQVW